MNEQDLKGMIQQDIDRLEHASKESEQLIKDKVIHKLSSIVDTLKIDLEKEKPSKIDSKINVINSLVNAITTYEKSIRDTVKTKAKIMQDKELQDNISVIASEFIKKIQDEIKTQSQSLTSVDQYIDDTDKTIDQRNDINISEDEISLEDTLKNQDIDQMLEEHMNNQQHEKEE